MTQLIFNLILMIALACVSSYLGFKYGFKLGVQYVTMNISSFINYITKYKMGLSEEDGIKFIEKTVAEYNKRNKKD